MSVLLDAGPALNFLAVGQQNILIQTAKLHDLQLAAPEQVDVEVEGMTNDPRFKRTGVLGTWRTLKNAKRLLILDDTLDRAHFVDAVTRISGMPASQRVNQRRSLGEIMVLAHASVRAQEGQDAFVLMDDGDARRRAKLEVEWLERREAKGRVRLWSTSQILREAATRPGWIAGGLTCDAVYAKMRTFDDGLPPLKRARPAENQEPSRQ